MPMFQAGPRGRAKGRRHVKIESVFFFIKTLAFPETPPGKVPVISSQADADSQLPLAARECGGEVSEHFNRVHCHPNTIRVLLVRKEMSIGFWSRRQRALPAITTHSTIAVLQRVGRIFPGVL